MTEISAKIIADSINPQGIRLTTMQLRYPRTIHAEFMTHRVFSRNASSSRAVPVDKLIADVERDPATPLHWGRNQPGMQAGDELTVEEVDAALLVLQNVRADVLYAARRLTAIGAHKQIVNRLLEPFSHINVVVTATDWANFFALRCHSAVEPHMRMLAEAMRGAQQASTPMRLVVGQWHLPYVTPAEWVALTCQDSIAGMLGLSRGIVDDTAIRCSVARCARVSYLTTEGKPPTVEADLALYERLVGAAPMHASAAEHQATPDEFEDGPAVDVVQEDGSRWRQVVGYRHPELHGNFRGWCQYRKTLTGECSHD
jgi:hypothetical protein